MEINPQYLLDNLNRIRHKSKKGNRKGGTHTYFSFQNGGKPSLKVLGPKMLVIESEILNRGNFGGPTATKLSDAKFSITCQLLEVPYEVIRAARENRKTEKEADEAEKDHVEYFLEDQKTFIRLTRELEHTDAENKSKSPVQDLLNDSDYMPLLKADIKQEIVNGMTKVDDAVSDALADCENLEKQWNKLMTLHIPYGKKSNNTTAAQNAQREYVDKLMKKKSTILKWIPGEDEDYNEKVVEVETPNRKDGTSKKDIRRFYIQMPLFTRIPTTGKYVQTFQEKMANRHPNCAGLDTVEEVDEKDVNGNPTGNKTKMKVAAYMQMPVQEMKRKMEANEEGKLVPVGNPKDPPNEENSEWVEVVYDPLGTDNPVPVGSIIQPYMRIEPIHEDGVSGGAIVFWGTKIVPEMVFVNFKGSGTTTDDAVGKAAFVTGSYESRRNKREREHESEPNCAPPIGHPPVKRTNATETDELGAKRQRSESVPEASPEELEAARAKIEEQRKADIDRVAKEMDGDDTPDAGAMEETPTPTGDEPATTAMEDDPSDDEDANTEEF